MTVEEITQTLRTVAENQATHSANMAKIEEMQARHSADIAEIDKQIAAIVESQNRHDRQLARIFEMMGKNEERFAELAESQRRLEGSYELLESFVRDFRNESRDYFTETDRKLARLAEVQAATAELVAGFVRETNSRSAEVDIRQSRTDDQINALVLAQTRTDEVVRSFIEHNGSKSKSKAKVKKAKNASKKKVAK
jgi:hypothetical protein